MLILLFGVLAPFTGLARGGSGSPNMLIRDCIGDNGAEPTSSSTCYVVWNSPDIKAQPSQGFNSAVPHGAYAGQKNYVYVDLKNIGSAALPTGSGRVYVYWAKSAGNQVWPTGWINHYDAQSRLIGNYIGYADIPSVSASGTTQVEIEWAANNVPDPAAFNEVTTHICLVAIFESDDDPLHATNGDRFNLGPDMLLNTRANNNIGWRNCDISRRRNPNTHCIVGNRSDVDGTYRVRFTEAGGGFLNNGTLTVDLGAGLMAIWEAGGNVGRDVTRVDGTNKVNITGTDAEIGNLAFAAGTEHTIKFSYAVPDDAEFEEGQTFEWNIAQHLGDADEPMGGVTVIIDPKRQPDVIIRDCPSDNGAEPSTVCSIHWNSPNIKVEPTQSVNSPNPDPNVAHSAKAGQTNYVYVKVENVGPAQLNFGTVQVYWAMFAVNQIWSSGWISYYIGGKLAGDYIGSANVTNLSSGSSVWVEVPWSSANMPDPSAWGHSQVHICLVARFVSNEDPMTFAEGPNMLTNTSNNNNIGWRNLDVAKADDPKTHILVGNSTKNAGNFEIRFAQGDEDFLPHGTITVDLGEDLFAVWEDGGAEVTGARRASTTPGNTKLIIEDPEAAIHNLELAAEEQYTIVFAYSLKEGEELDGRTFEWNVSQHVDGADEPMGGATIEIVLENEGADGTEGKRSVAPAEENGAEYNLSARPNPTGGATTIAYTLPTDARVSVEIYDAAGNLVRTLVEKTEQAKGPHAIEWNGLTSGGALVPAGTYFYRLSTGDRSVEQQIKIVR